MRRWIGGEAFPAICRDGPQLTDCGVSAWYF